MKGTGRALRRDRPRPRAGRAHASVRGRRFLSSAIAKSKRQIVLQRKPEQPGSLAPMGSRQAVLETLARCNTSPDGSPPRNGAMGQFLYGPGLIAEVPFHQDPIAQVMVQINDLDLAWPVLRRLCAAQQWQMVDVESGQVFG